MGMTTLIETNCLHLKMDGWNPFGMAYFQGRWLLVSGSVKLVINW